MTGQSPLVEATSSRIGTNVTSSEIDGLPSANRSQFSLMQTIPGLVPVLQVGSFEGGQFSANGQATTNNLFLVDGQNDNDSRRGGSQGTQARVSLDSMAEYQVQTHQYAAEYGGSTGVVVNSVTKSGTNKLSGRVFEYYQSNKLQATNYFLKQAGQENPESGSNVFGGSLGGPIVKNKLFFFGNYEGTRAKSAANLIFPAAAAPLAVSYSTTTAFHGPNTFARFDYHAERQQPDQLPLDARGRSSPSAIRSRTTWPSLERRPARERFGRPGVQRLVDVGAEQPHDQRAEVRARAREPAAGAEPAVRRQLEVHRLRAASIRSTSDRRTRHPDYIAGPRNSYAQDLIRDVTIDDTLTWIKSGWGGDHTFKVGAALQPQRRAAAGHGRRTSPGMFTFPTDAPFNAADPTTYPYRFGISMGQFDFTQIDHRASGYIQDKWQVNNRLTLNLGVRYDWQELTDEHQGRDRSALRRRLRR